MLSGKVVYSDRAINFNLTGPDCKLDDLGTGFEIAEGYRIGGMHSSNWRWHLDEVFVEIKG